MSLTARPSETRLPERLNSNKARFSSAPLQRYRTPRPVPPFSIQSQQKNTIVIEESKFSARGKHRNGSHSKRPTSFRMYYDRGDLPIKMEYLTGGDKIGWTVDIEKLDYSLYLPLFFDGLSETKHPYKTYARQGVLDLLTHGGDKIHPVIPQLILPIKNALSTKNLEVMCTTLKILQQLVMSSDLVGPALVPFYRQLLPMFNSYKVKNLNCGDEIDYSQKNNMNLGDLIDETLQVLEMHGGEDAFINIKSCFKYLGLNDSETQYVLVDLKRLVKQFRSICQKSKLSNN